MTFDRSNGSSSTFLALENMVMVLLFEPLPSRGDPCYH